MKKVIYILLTIFFCFVNQGRIQAQKVGTIPGTIDVSPTGGATYNIPIDIPEGINGMQPNISLVYNSQGGSGSVGVGWGISGLSAVSRGTKNVFSDDAISGLDLSKNEKYTLDGNTLLGITGTYGADGTTYKTENKTYSIVKSIGQATVLADPASTTNTSTTTYPLSFNVTTKDGQIIEYSNKVIPINYNLGNSVVSSQPLQWMIAKVTDANANSMNYIYFGEAGIVPIINTISYGEVTIAFSYDQKTVIPKSFVNGYYLLDKYLLRSIRILVRGTTQKLYNLSYNYDTQKQKYFLSDIALVGQNNAQLNSTTIQWGPDYQTVNTNTANPTSVLFDRTLMSDINCTTSDINGDGISELVEFYHDNSQNKNFVAVHKINSQNGVLSYGSLLSNQPISPNYQSSNFKTYTTSGLFADFNGDSKKTILVPSYFDILGSKHVEFDDPNSTIAIIQPLNYSSEMTAYAIGDINNDGVDEIISMEKASYSRIPGPKGAIYYVNNNRTNDSFSADQVLKDEFSFGGMIPTDGRNFISGIPKSIFIADFNGDGLKDLMITTDIGCFFMKNNGGIKGADGIVHVTFTEMKDNIITDFNSNYSTIKAGDFNGDGLIDFVLNEHCNANWKLAINNGRWGFNYYPLSNFTAVEESNTTNNDDKEDCIVTDFNHDGKSDIVLVDPVYNSNNFVKTNVTWYTSTGTAFNIAKTFTTTDVNFTFNRYNTTGDFNGDGKEEVLSYGSDMYGGANESDMLYINSTFNTGVDFNTNFEANQVKSITDGMGNKTELVYQPLTYAKTTDGKDFYITGTDAVYPVVDVIAPINCVQKINQPIGNGNIATTAYAYTGAKVHVNGKGFLGFKSQMASNATTNRNVVTTTEMDYALCLPTKQTTIISTLTGNGDISKNETTIYNTKSADKVYTSLPTRTVERDILKDMVKVTFPTYDSWNNLTGINTTYSDSRLISMFDSSGNLTGVDTSSGFIATTTQTIGYGQFGTWAWCLNKPISSTTVQQKNGQSDTRTKLYEYDSKANLTKETIDPTDENSVMTEYKDFDSFGHAKTIAVTANANTRTSKVTFTTSGRFIISKINALGQTTVYDWDEALGLLNSETDYRGNKTTYTYDNFGRLITTLYPTGISKVVDIGFANSNGAKYYNYTTVSGSAPEYLWYDALGHEIEKDTYGLNRGKISIYTEYYPDGKLYRVSDPLFYGTNKTWAATYTYDSYGRPLSVTTPMGTTSTVYGTKTTTVTTPEGTQETTINNWGQTLTSKENGKTVTYTYYPSDLTKTSTPQDGQALNMEYDLQGNRTKLTDPDVGTVESKYNGFGELLWEKQKVRNTIDYITTTNNYDSNGLLQNINRNGEITLYTYDTQYKNRVSTIEIAGKNKQTFTYDAFDRVMNVKEEIGSRVYNTGKEYDTYGRVSKEIYPSGYYTQNTYDSYNFGNLFEVKDNASRSIWKAVDENARRQITQISKGGVTTYFGFDSRGFPTAITSNNVNLVYNFDSKGNLANRRDNINGQYEVFQYDAFNRLTNWDTYNGRSGALIKQNSLAYDATTSNIASKSDLNNLVMNYGGKRADGSDIGPHALATISGVPTNFPTADLNVTYTDFKKIATLSEGNKYYALSYGVDDQRRKSEYSVNGVLQQTRYYVGNYEEEVDKNGNVRKIHYLTGAILIQNNGKDSLLYAYSDFQGSLLALMDVSGNVVEKYAYDPWGVKRNPADWSQNDLRTKWIVNRGYTGHEHLDAFGIINMNGRVYDSLTAQFFSPDSYVQAPGNWLNYNRYAYCYGNPFKYRDPSGEYLLIDDIVGAVISGVVNVAINLGNIHSLGQGISYFGVGASGYIVSEYASPVVGGMYMATANNVLSQGFANGFKNIDISQAMFSGIMGGLTAQAGQYIGKFVGPEMGKFASTITKSPVIQQAITQSTTYAIGGFAIGTGFSLANGKSFDDALASGGQSALMGFGIGAVNGVVSGIQYSHKYNVNPWTGELKPVYHYTNSAYVNSINETEIRQSNDGFTYTTTNPNYSSDEAMKALYLDEAGGVRNAVVKIDAAKMAADGILPAIGPRPVVNGTGVEILYKGDIPSKYIFK